MMRTSAVLCRAPICALGLLIGLAGCATPQSPARRAAGERWNAARAQVKARMATSQLESGDLANAAEQATEAVRLDPNNPEMLALQVRVCLAQGQLARAESTLETARGAHPHAAELAYLLGIVRQEQQRWTDAAELFGEAHELDTAEVAYFVAAVQCRLQLGDVAGAQALLAAGAERFGWTAAYQAALAECHEQGGDWAAAAAAWSRVADARGAASDVRMRLADALCHAERYSDSIPVLLELSADLSGDELTSTRLLLADSYLMTGQPAEAREQVQAVLHEAPNHARALRLLAWAWGAERQWAPALRAARRAAAAQPEHGPTLELLATLAWKGGDAALARTTAERLARRDASNPIAQYILGR